MQKDGRINEKRHDQMAKQNLRLEMPITTAWIDDLRAAFGKAYIDEIIRRGMRGDPVFSASEAGHTIGTPVPPGAAAININEAGKPSVKQNLSKWES